MRTDLMDVWVIGFDGLALAYFLINEPGEGVIYLRLDSLLNRQARRSL